MDFVILLWSILAWNGACWHVWTPSLVGRRWHCAKQHEACYCLGGRHRPAVIPELGNLLSCPRRGHSKARTRLCLAQCRFLRTCWSITVDELIGKKARNCPWRWFGEQGWGRRSWVQSSCSGWREDFLQLAPFSPLFPTLLWMNPAPLILVAWQVSAVHTVKLPQTCPWRPRLATPTCLLPEQELCKKPHKQEAIGETAEEAPCLGGWGGVASRQLCC